LKSGVQSTVGEARRLAEELLHAAGMPEGPAGRTAWALVLADVWGNSSHGLMRLPYYLRRFEAGGTDPAARMSVVSETVATAAYDGGNGLGHWQVWEAAERATAKAGEYGIAAVSVANSGHCGSLGLYTLPMVDAGIVGLVFSNGPAVMPPWGGDKPVLSTSPVAAGIPTGPYPAIVDLATSAVARGTIAERQSRGEPLEPGWAFDSHGESTVDPTVALSGMLAPMGGAKGYALAFLVEALTGGMVGPNLAVDVADPLSDASAGLPQGIAHLVIALDPSAFDGNGQSPARLSTLVQRIGDAGGRIPGSKRSPSASLDDDAPLTVPEKTAEAVAGAAARAGVGTPLGWPSPRV